MLALLTLVGMSLAWAGAQKKWIKDRQEVLQWLESRDFPGPREGVQWRTETISYRSGNNNAPWSLRLFGARGIDSFAVYPTAHDLNGRYQVQALRQLFPEAQLSFLGPNPKKVAQRKGPELVAHPPVDNANLHSP